MYAHHLINKSIARQYKPTLFIIHYSEDKLQSKKSSLWGLFSESSSGDFQ